ncbi:MAG TPA: carboxypeptidase-like regulatory domain-containing protein [Gemmatimonadaceae bacterium]
MRRLMPLLLGLSLVTPQAGAQVVGGVVTDRVSAQPLAGVLVSVELARDSTGVVVRNALSNRHGEFRITLPSPGRYRLTAKRIGVARFTSPSFDLASGEVRRLDVALDPFAAGLPTVRVAGTNLCLKNSDQLRPIVALWDEVETALIATEISRRDRLVVGWLSRYARVLDPKTLRIFEEQRTVAAGRYESPMRSISGDSLASFGYWGKLGEDTLVFHAPDAEALLSPAFRSGHCFLMVRGTGSTRGMVGLAFGPRVARVIGGIEGTIWIDAGNHELRFLEFRYTNLITIPRNPHLGGQVHFLRDPSGAWMVHRWLIRMPRFPEVTSLPRSRDGYLPQPRPEVHRILEEGGSLFAPGLQTWERPGTIAGTVMDSTGRRPLTGTLVSLSGTPHSAEVDARGSFRFDSIPPGAYTLLASHPGYGELGQLVDDEPLTLSPGQTFRTRMRALTTQELLGALCGGKLVLPGEATLRVQALHADSAVALHRLPLWLRWLDPVQRAPIDPISANAGRLQGIESMTDDAGVVTFCGVPAGIPLELVMLRSDDDITPFAARVVRTSGWTLKAGEILSRTINVRRPR